ncbi:unnamed protein product [Linum trigynum]|uniref:non-specific serine/threonine protein kinase n=1 Tax=Linum trigynum TaxID=586398 RepID=A0AAV2D793_9ROSI
MGGLCAGQRARVRRDFLEFTPPTGDLTAFQPGELQQIIEQGNQLGDGGCGTIFGGALPEHGEVAVKVINENGPQGIEELENELNILYTVRHTSVIRPVGFCMARGLDSIVFPRMSSGTLEKHLHDVNNGQLLEWNVRLDIACEVIQGLSYLQNNDIVHRDIKSSNVLLDEEFHAKLSDFGFAKVIRPDDPPKLRIREGTIGYCPPETNVGFKTDVYSFGVLLLELVTGQTAYEVNRAPGRELAKWAEPVINAAMNNNDFTRVVDGRLQGRANMDGVRRACVIARLCTNDDVNERYSLPATLSAVLTLRADFRFDEEGPPL